MKTIFGEHVDSVIDTPNGLLLYDRLVKIRQIITQYASVKSKINYIKVHYGDFFKHKYHSWTTADIETLKQMTADGCSGYEIATKIGATPAAVYEYRRLLGIQRRQKNNGLPYGEASHEDKR